MSRYPSDGAEAARRLFRRWLGARFARAVSLGDWQSDEHLGGGRLEIGRRWTVGLTVVNTLAVDASLPWEAARGAIEQRFDAAGLSVALFAPRGATLPAQDPGLAELLHSTQQRIAIPDGRFEVRRPVRLFLRRTSPDGAVVTVLGGLAGLWAQFTNRVPGTFQLNSAELLRLPSDRGERDELFQRIVLAAGQPDVDESVVVSATDAWTAVDLEEGGSAVLGTPRPENEEWSASLRRNLRRLLQRANGERQSGCDATALAILGAATYAEDERLSWSLRGMDPTLYAGYDFVVVVADGVTRAVLEPPPGSLPWDP